MDERVVVVGAGPAGLAAAWAIRRVGVDPLIAEKAGVVAASWRARHDQLRLNTHRMFSHQPGVRIPRRYGPFPARDEYVAYLERYAAGLRIRFGAAVGRIDRAGPGWQLDLGAGSLSTAQVVVATGPDAEPVMPRWPGMAGFPGTLIHSGQFRNTGEMAGRDVLVVGPGNSGVDLLNHLVRSDAARLWLSARSGMNITPLRLAGIPLHPVSLAGRRLPRRIQDANVRMVQRLAFGDLRRHGYPRSELGAVSRLAAQGVTVAVDDGFVRALKAGRVTVKPTHTAMYRCATVSQAELGRMRHIENVVRLGRVVHIAADRIVLEEGSIPTDGGQVHVDCSAAGLRLAPGRPAFDAGRITLQQIRTCQPAFNAALVGYVEATRHDDAEKNRLCPPNPYPDTAIDWIPATCIAQRAQALWLADTDLSAWIEGARLNAVRGIGDHLADPRMKSALTRLFANAEPAVAKLETLQAQAQQAGR